MKQHINIPIFIPHLGCPNQCVFCNQRTISGVKEFDISSVRRDIDTALLTVDSSTEAEIAFFGGSFTGIDRDLMIELLEIGYEYIKDGRVSSIRCSTRPDYIDEEILEILKKYGVRVIELGLQSVEEKVLKSSKRGHNFQAELKACRMIVNAGFALVGQMMIGLPESTLEGELETARFIISVGASSARIYPTVVFHGTELCDRTKAGVYEPLKLDDAVRRTARVMREFLKSGVKVIRIGLCASEKLTSPDTYFAGPNHPSLGELVEGEIYYDLICERLDSMLLPEGAELTVEVAYGELSKVIGQKKANKVRINTRYKTKKIKFTENSGLSKYEIRVFSDKGE